MIYSIGPPPPPKKKLSNHKKTATAFSFAPTGGLDPFPSPTPAHFISPPPLLLNHPPPPNPDPTNHLKWFVV